MQYGQNRPFEPGRPIELADAQVHRQGRRRAAARQRRCRAASLDEFGEPVADAERQRRCACSSTNGKRRLVPSGATRMTNDLGQFRLYGLPPGEYYVSATLRNIRLDDADMLGGGGVGGPDGSNQNSGYASTYYPGTPSPAEAQRVSLAVGQELASVDIAAAAGAAREDHRQRDGLRRQADGRRDGHADAGDDATR